MGISEKPLGGCGTREFLIVPVPLAIYAGCDPHSTTRALLTCVVVLLMLDNYSRPGGELSNSQSTDFVNRFMVKTDFWCCKRRVVVLFGVHRP